MRASLLTAEPNPAFDVIVIHRSLLAAELDTAKTRFSNDEHKENLAWLTAEPNAVYDLKIVHTSPLTAKPSLAYDMILMHSSLLAAELGTAKTRFSNDLQRSQIQFITWILCILAYWQQSQIQFKTWKLPILILVYLQWSQV